MALASLSRRTRCAGFRASVALVMFIVFLVRLWPWWRAKCVFGASSLAGQSINMVVGAEDDVDCIFAFPALVSVHCYAFAEGKVSVCVGAHWRTEEVVPKVRRVVFA